MKFLIGIVRYIHYMTGITTPRPEQERLTVIIWIVSIFGITALTVAVFLLLGPRILSTR